MSSDDLTELFAPAPTAMGASSTIVQGTILTFSNINGANTVKVNGATLTNVPMLLTGAEVNYTAGDSVLLLVLGNTYMLLGKVAMVGSAQFASASVTTASATAGNTTFAIPATTIVNGASLTLSVPPWANRAAIIGSHILGVTYGTTSGWVSGGITLDGEVGHLQGATAQATWQWLVATALSTTHTVTPGGTLTCTGQAEALFAIGSGSASSTLNATAIFYKQ
jgi:hypothetical protein